MGDLGFMGRGGTPYSPLWRRRVQIGQMLAASRSRQQSDLPLRAAGGARGRTAWRTASRCCRDRGTDRAGYGAGRREGDRGRAERDAEVLVLRLDTPAGLADSMREIIVAILASERPLSALLCPRARSCERGNLHPLCHACRGNGAAPLWRGDAGTDRRLAQPAAARRRKAKRGGRWRVGVRRNAPGGRTEPEKQRRRRFPTLCPPRRSTTLWPSSVAADRDRNADWAEEAVREAASLSASQARERN